MSKLKKPVGFFGNDDSRNLKTKETINLEPKDASNLGSKEEINLEDQEFRNKETSKPRNIKTKEPIIVGTKKSISLENEEHIKLENVKSKNLRTKKPINLEVKESRSRKSKQNPNSKGLINQGYMIDEELIAVLGIYTAFQSGEDKDKSTVIRNSLRSYIPERYFKMYQSQKEDN